jgi:uncharacterized membrane protein YbhN (UPF0104 family)
VRVGERALDTISAGFTRFDHVDWRLLALAIACQLLGSVCHARAWANVLQAARPDRHVPRGAVLCAHLAGVAGSAVAPARAGDGARILLIRRAVPGTAVATIVTTLVLLTAVDAVLGGSALVAMASSSLGPQLPAIGRTGPMIAAAALVVGAIVAVLARRRLAGVLRQMRQGAALLSSPGRFAREAVSWQAGAWLARVGVAFLVLHAFGLPASLVDALLVVVVTGLSGVIPFLPGGVGVQQAMLVYALRKTASAASVISFGIGMQVGVTLVDVGIGLLALLVTFRTLALRDAFRATRRLA